MVYKKRHKRDQTVYYYIRFRGPQGKLIKELAGTTRRQAERLYQKRRGEVVSGTYVNPRKKKAKATTFGEFQDRFMRDYGSLRRSNHYEERGKVARAYFGKDTPFREAMTRVRIDRYRVAREQGAIEGYRPAGPSTVKKDLTYIGTLCRMAVRWDVLEANPASDLDKPREPRANPRPFSVEQYRAIRDGAPPWLRPLIRLSAVTGLEPIDVVGLRWDDVDLDQGLMFVTRSKTQTPMEIPIGEVARDVLEAAGTRFRGGHVLVDSAGNSFSSQRQRNQISQRFTALLIQLGIRQKGEGRKLEEGASWKTLRRTVASWAGDAGFSETQIAETLGHSRGRSMTSRYIRLNRETLRGIIRALDAAEGGSVPQRVPQAQTSAAASGGESSNLNPTKQSSPVGT